MVNRQTLNDVVNISMPAIGETIIYTVISIFDTMFIGKFGGKEAVSSVGLPTEIANTFINIFIVFGISIAITSYIARANGSKANEAAEEYAFIGIIFGTVVSMAVTFIFYKFPYAVLNIGGQKGKVLLLGITYMKLSSLGVFFNMINSLISSVFRGYGDTYTPFLGSCILFLFNIFLDYVLIYGNLGIPSLGVVGAAIAKNISYVIEFVFLALFLHNRSLLKIRFKSKYTIKRLKKLILLSIPASLEEAAFSLSRLLSSFILMDVGTAAYAANQIANTAESISFMPVIGLGIGATTLVGIKVGEGKIKEAENCSKECTLIGIGIMICFSILFFNIPTLLINNFIDIKEVSLAASTAACLKIGAFEQPFFAISIVLAAALKGSGNTKDPFYISLFSSWVIRIPLIYYFIYLNRYPVTCVWWITCVQWGIDALITYIIFNKNFRKFRGFTKIK